MRVNESVYLNVIREIFALEDFTHPLLVGACINLARIYQSRGDHKRTIAFYTDVLSHIEPGFKNDLLLVCAYEALVCAHRSLKQPHAAAFFQKKLTYMTQPKHAYLS